MSTALSNSGAQQTRALFRPLEALQHEFENLFGHMSGDWDGHWLMGDFKAACDLSETADAFEIRMDMPGMKPEDINIEVTGDIVHISGERKDETKEEKGKTFHRVERRSGSFSETIRLPGSVNDGQVQAEFHDGVLTITLPKNQASKTRTVKVRARGNQSEGKP